MRKIIAMMLVTSTLLSACGGGGGGSNAEPQPVQTAPAAAAPKVTLLATKSINPADPSDVVVSDGGTTISYYADSGGSATEALFRTANGMSSRIFYNADGSISRIVDEGTGNVVFIAERQDHLGTDYIAFDASGTFIGGQSIYRDSVTSTWYTAPLLGEIGQVVGALGGPLSASFAMKADSLAYGSPTAVDPNLQQVLGNDTRTSVAATALDFFLPAAHAQSIPPSAYVLLARAAALSVAGGMIYTTAPLIGTALLVGGAVSLYQGLTHAHRSLFDQLDLSMDAILRDRLTADLGNAVDPAASLRASVNIAIASGIDSMRAATASLLGNAVGSIANLVLTPAIADTRPAMGTLPALAAGNTTLSGTFVDANNAVYPARGAIDSNGDITATGVSPSGTKIEVSAHADGGPTGAVTGQYRAVDANGQTVATGALAQAAVASLGKCQTTSNSGGLGTFAYAYNIGARSGTFTLDYDMYSIPDAMSIVVGNNVVFTTNGVVSGSSSLSIPFTDGDTAFINVSAPTQGTQWTFTLGCAQ